MTAQNLKKSFYSFTTTKRSQMAGRFLKSLYGEHYDVYSAGTNPNIVNPYAVKVLEELSVDISENRSKSLKEFEGLEFDFVVTVCGGGSEVCPFFPGGKNYLHESFEDPTAVDGTEYEKTVAFRRIRDEIKGWIKETFRGD
jgi:arsenate reductase (thioredoxin)